MPPDFSKDEFSRSLNVSRETLEKLEIYLKLLMKWQRAINLVGSKTLQNAWERHFVDSAQLLPLIPEDAKTIVDIGSGAGFPGLVLAILNPSLNVHLIESDAKKCQFIKTVSRETNTRVIVHNCRIESCPQDIKPDLVSARALASLENLLDYTILWAGENENLKMLFLKGESVGQEIEDAQKKYQFTHEAFPSDTDDRATILRIANLCIK